MHEISFRKNAVAFLFKGTFFLVTYPCRHLHLWLSFTVIMPLDVHQPMQAHEPWKYVLTSVKSCELDEGIVTWVQAHALLTLSPFLPCTLIPPTEREGGQHSCALLVSCPRTRLHYTSPLKRGSCGDAPGGFDCRTPLEYCRTRKKITRSAFPQRDGFGKEEGSP
jgi:hypothetical protein